MLAVLFLGMLDTFVIISEIANTVFGVRDRMVCMFSFQATVDATKSITISI